MKSTEERLRELPEIAQHLNVEADERMRRSVLQKAKRPLRKNMKAWMIPVSAVLIAALALGVTLRLRSADAPLQPLNGGRMGDGSGTLVGAVQDVQPGSFTITTAQIPSYASIWAAADGANFPLVNVQGKVYRLLTAPTNISQSLLGSDLGQVTVHTSEPALAQGDIISNALEEGTHVYEISGKSGAMIAAEINGNTRVFQRVSYADASVQSGESLGSTLQADNVIALQLSGVGTVDDESKARELYGTLLSNASYVKASASETGQTLILQLSNGLTLQMAVDGEKLMACGTWACAEFFEAFNAAIGQNE